MGEAIERWGSAEGTSRRPDLPWRSTRDPWAVLVSETLAQQTQLVRVVPAYHRFLGAFPTPGACAAAPLGDVLRAWEGMGYNRRARNLHGAAQAVVARHSGRVPDDLDALLALPGVGPYTARAVLAFAFEADVAAVDVNVARVIVRALTGDPVSAGQAQVIADALVPRGRGWLWNQSVMEIGAVLCTARAPLCELCPLASLCSWAAKERPSPDPAAARSKQSAFVGSDRQGRGRLVNALREGPVTRRGLAAACGWPDDAGRARRVADSLVSEGLARRGSGGVLSLP